MPALAVKVAVVAAGETATAAGVVSSMVLLDKATKRPPEGAAPLRVTLQLATPPDVSAAGLHFNPVGTVGASSPSEKTAEDLFSEAVMVAVLTVVTAEAIASKTAVLLPAATVTEAGVVNKMLLSDRVMSAPPVGAAPVKVTVHVTVAGPVADAGLQLNANTSTEDDTVTRPPVADVVIGMAVEEAEDTSVI